MKPRGCGLPFRKSPSGSQDLHPILGVSTLIYMGHQNKPCPSLLVRAFLILIPKFKGSTSLPCSYRKRYKR